MKVYEGFQLTVIELPNGSFCVDIMPIGGVGRSVRTQAHRDASAALASARLTIDRVAFSMATARHSRSVVNNPSGTGCAI
jgi:hypothetical protein